MEAPLGTGPYLLALNLTFPPEGWELLAGRGLLELKFSLRANGGLLIYMPINDFN